MKSKTNKAKELALLKDKLPNSKVVVFTSFSKAGEKGLSVSQMTALKKLLRSSNSEYFVIKKTLIDLAIKDKRYDGLDIYGMDGSIGLVLGDNDVYKIAKDVYEFSKKNSSLHFWGAVTDGKFLGLDAFLEIAKMPSRETLIVRLLGMMKYPLTGLYVVLSETAKQRVANSSS
ncbi:MAG: 50S ribosomal protein L10 [Patescibacteria group bacterium]